MTRTARYTTLFLALTLGSCSSPEELEEIKRNQILLKSNQQEIQYNQKKILAKLDAIEEKLAKPAPAAAPRNQAARPGKPDPTARYAIAVGDSPSKGPDDAWVTIVEISEFQCPYCKRVGPALKQIEETFGDDVRFVFKHNPLSFHNRAMPAAIASECAREQGKFWEMHDQLFANQRQLDDSSLERYAGNVGVDLDKWKACYAEARHKDRVLADQRAAVSLGAAGTPAFFINGRFISGAQPYAKFEQIIKQELSRATSSGVDKASYYATEVEAKGRTKI